MEVLHPSNPNYQKIASRIFSENPTLEPGIEQATNLKKKDVKTLFVELLKFLQMIAYTRSQLTPSDIVAQAWQQFILRTEAYYNYCEEKFGRYIHHLPDDGNGNVELQYENALKNYITFLGKPDERFWASISGEGTAEAKCATCTGK